MIYIDSFFLCNSFFDDVVYDDAPALPPSCFSFFVLAMAPCVLRRWDEPHLFDALCALFASVPGNDDRYGTVAARGTTYEYFFKTRVEMLVFVRGSGSYADLEEAALEAYDADPVRDERARDLAAFDPSFGGRPHCRVL